MSVRRLVAPTLAALLLLASSALPAGGESSLSFSPPEVFGDIAADTYDERGHRVGGAALRVERLESGNVRIEAVSGIDGSARNAAYAELAPTGADGTLRLVREQTQAVDLDGTPLGVTTIDHVASVAVCGTVNGSRQEPARIALPDDDRVVNVPLNLLFQPLVQGDVEEIDFQILLCRRGARIVSARAQVAGVQGQNGSRFVEIRYDLDLGPILSQLAAPFLPRLSFWFQEDSPGGWVGHRMPLFSQGPTVFVVRSGFSPNLLGAGR